MDLNGTKRWGVGMTEKQVRHFLSKIHFSNDCWNWQGYKTPEGYGKIQFDKKRKYAHRISYELFFGPLKENVCCHKCDNPSCVNPLHLFSGTQKDNVEDMYEKGRRKIKNKTHCKRGHKLETSHDGRNKRCKICARNTASEWRKNNRERHLENFRRWISENRK